MNLSYTNIVRQLFDLLEENLMLLKIKTDIPAKPMLHYFRLRNLINTYTDLIIFMLSFPIPLA